MRALRLIVFSVAIALLGGSFATAASRAANRTTGADRSDEVRRDGDARENRGTGVGNGSGRGLGADDAPLGAPPAELVALPERPVDPDAVALPEPPRLGETAGAVANRGTVRIKRAGDDEFTKLEGAETVPMGSTVDATNGLAQIVVAATQDGIRQSAVLTGGVFAVTQSTPAADVAAVTDLTLRGGDFSDCGRAPKPGKAHAAAAKRRTRGGVVRGLWAAAKGNFRTRGRHSAATVRGTRWATVDRCGSTTVKVFEGIVDVMDFSLDEVFTVRGGERHVARPS